MLSILIPTYDYNCYSLVSELYNQCVKLGFPFEIIVQDDASHSELNVENLKITSLKNCYFHTNSENLGRGKNINSLAEKASFNWLLLLDCDVFPKHNYFIEKYFECIEKKDFNVFFGGICYKPEKPKENEMLRWIYGIKREAIPSKERQQNPYKSALTSNLLIKKELFSAIQFDENITKYGYEDLLFIKNLKEKSVAIEHIENEGYHLNLETSIIYLGKIKASLQNLSMLYKIDKSKIDESKIVTAYNFLEKTNTTSIVSFLYKKLEKRLEKHLLSNNPKLRILDIYKLGYFCMLNEK